MFGYLKPDISEMKVREYEAYKSAYCGLCKTIGKSYGIVSRLTLSYDCTMLAMLYASLKDEKLEYTRKRCTSNPLKKCNFCLSDGDSFRFAGAVCVIMTYYKLEDIISDSGFFKRLAARAGKLFFAVSHRRAKKAYPQIEQAVKQLIHEQAEVEKLPSCGIDASAEPTARVLSHICVMMAQDEKEKAVLKYFGYYVGRWIYLIDAADDFEDDVKHKSFNPFANAIKSRHGISDEEAKQYFNSVLNATAAEIVAAYNLLNIRQNKPILDNIISLGLGAMQKRCIFEKSKKGGK